MIRISFVGDICLDKKALSLIDNQDYSNLFGDSYNCLIESDFRVGNLECPITLSTNPIKKLGPNLKTKPEAVSALKYAGFDLLCLANNHILDYGEEGIIDTLKYTSLYNIDTVGAGKNIFEARKPFYKIIKGKTFGFINACEIEFSIADKDRYGANPIDLINLYYDIIEAKKKSDYLILILHGNNEYYNLPNPTFRKQCHFFIDLGVNSIICHHSHFIGPVEVYKNSPIFYGLGNFIFPRDGKPDSWNIGLIVQIEYDNENISWRIIPFRQNESNISIEILHDKDKLDVIERVNQLFGIVEIDCFLESKWLDFLLSKERMYYGFLFGFNRIEKYLFRFSKLRFVFYSKSRLYKLYDVIACDSHRNSLLRILEKEIKPK